MLAAVLLLLQSPAGLPSADLSADARLDRPLAIEARIEPLPDLLARIGKATGAALTVERKMAGLKATVLVGARPARRTMADLASVFDAGWVPVEGGYRLEMDIPARNRMASYLDRERAVGRETAERDLREAARIAEIPWAEIPDRLGAAMQALGGFRLNTDPGFAEAHARYEALDRVSRDGHRYLLGHLARGLSEDDLTALWNGRAFYASRAARGGIPPLPPGSARIGGMAVQRVDASGTVVDDPAPVRMFVRYDADAGGLAWAMNAGGGSARATPGTSWGGDDPALLAHRYRKALEAWATDLSIPEPAGEGAPPSPAGPPELDRPLRRIEPIKPIWEGPWANDADLLANLRAQSGLDVVAEATRRASRRGSQPFSEATVRAALEGWSFRGDARLEDGALLYRPYAFWRRRAEEPPETAMRRWEARPDRGMDAMADLVAGLSPAQARMLGAMNSTKLLKRFEEGLSALRLWGALGSAERARLRAGEPVPLSGLNLPAREAALAALLEGIFEGATPSERMLALFDAPWDPSSLGAIALFGATRHPGGAQEIETGGWWLDTPAGTDASTAKLAPGPGFRLEIAPARGEGLAFTLPR